MSEITSEEIGMSTLPKEQGGERMETETERSVMVEIESEEIEEISGLSREEGDQKMEDEEERSVETEMAENDYYEEQKIKYLEILGSKSFFEALQFHRDNFFEFPSREKNFHPLTKKKRRRIEHIIALALFLMSCWDIGSDVFLFRDFYVGTNYSVTVPHLDHDWVQPRNFTAPFYGQLVIFENITNICELKRICEDVGLNKTSYTFSCYQQDPIFAILTLLFILNTAHMVFNAFFRKTCLHFLNIFLWVMLGFCLLIREVRGHILSSLFQSDIYYLWGIFSLLMGISALMFNDSNVQCRTYSYSFLKNIMDFIFQPVFILLSPIVIIVMKFRFIFLYNEKLFWQKQILSKAEGIRESLPQLVLQLYIVFTRFDRTPSFLQILVILSSLVAITIIKIDEFRLAKKLSGMKYFFVYFPYFFFKNGALVLKLSMYAALFKENGYIIMFIIILFLFVFHMILNGSLWFIDYKSGTAEKVLRFKIFKLIEHLSTIVILLILNIAPDMYIGGDIYLGWDKLPIIENIWYVNTILSFILAIELLVIPLLQFAYQRLTYGIINPPFYYGYMGVRKIKLVTVYLY